MEQKKTMIIVWKWEDIEDSGLDLNFPVFRRSLDRIIRINQINSTSNSLTLKSTINECINDGHKVLVFLHRDHHYEKSDVWNIYHSFKEVSNSGRLRVELFGGGEGILYFSYQQKGLLDDFGWFMDEPEFSFQYKDADGRVTEEIGKASVVTKNTDTDEWAVLPYFFDLVWNHYWFDYKAKLIGLKQDLLLNFQSVLFEPTSSDNNVPLDPLLKKRLEYFCDVTEKEKKTSPNSKDRASLESIINVKYLVGSSDSMHEFYDEAKQVGKTILEQLSSDKHIPKQSLETFARSIDRILLKLED